MGQKVHPYGFRVGITNNWKSRWFSKKAEFSLKFLEDVKIKRYIKKKLYQAAIANIDIERAGDRLRIIIFSARPGAIIGRKGTEIDSLKSKVLEMSSFAKDVFIDIKEIKQSALEAQLVAENVAFQLEKRMPFRRVIKKSVQMAKDAGAEGVRVAVKGRLGGAEIARTEKYMFGKIPLQTIRADIDYGFAEAHTAFGLIGVKVWICKGEKFSLYENQTKQEKN
ncbi:MAG: 30S ribosomal protein S3 [Candidatus Omnitrophica bacterium]|nr:30S ribosomal protein S3 [Candidatus Omnitrophota bacterium]